MLTTALKQPGETICVPLTFAGAITAIVDVTGQPRGLVPGATALTYVATAGGAQVMLSLAGGGDGERYLVTVRATLADGQTIEQEVDIAVVETGWALPGGGGLYLSIGDFAQRVGLDELVTITDPNGSGRIDAAMVAQKLGDAQAIVEGYLGGRYALPLASVPTLVAMAIADLALARLYPRGAPQGVADNAAAATKLLQGIQAGTTLLQLAGVAPPPAPSDAPIVVSPGRRAYPDNLAGY